MTVVTQVDEHGSAADVVYVLCLMQAAFVVLAGLGETLIMGGNPAFLVVPVAKMVVLVVLATKVVSRRRWAMIAVIVVQAVTLLGFWLQIGASLLPMLTFTPNLVGLLTNLMMPMAIIWLCANLVSQRLSANLVSRRSGPRSGGADRPTANLAGWDAR